MKLPIIFAVNILYYYYFSEKRIIAASYIRDAIKISRMNPILQFKKKMQFSKLYIKYYAATSYAIYPKNWAYS